MSRARFSRYLLRTTNVPAAAAFYDAVLERRGDGMVPLHEAALARGAAPHWLGHVRVRELGGTEATAARCIERGASRLGPAPGVADFVVLRDLGGALVGLTEDTAESVAGVVWHQLNTLDAAASADSYASLFGWAFAAELELGELGRHRRFAFEAGEANVGVFSNIEGRPNVHPHWLFFFVVPSLDTAVESVHSLGGIAIQVELPNGARVAACDDPQGAAFGLVGAADVPKLVQG